MNFAFLSPALGLTVHPDAVSSGDGGGLTNLIPLMLDGSHTYNPSAGVTVSLVDDTYVASIPEGDASSTTWYDEAEGKMVYVTFTDDLDVTALGVSISGADGTDIVLAGLIIWLNTGNWMFACVGDRAPNISTIEYKNNLNGVSSVSDIGNNVITDRTCDLRVTRIDGVVTFYYRQIGDTEWIPLPHSSLGGMPDLSTGPVRVGLITYGYAFIAALLAYCNAVYATEGVPT